MLIRLLALLLICLSVCPASAQQSASLQVAVEIIAPALTLSVSSSRMDFGQIGAADQVELHPETGTREGDAFGPHSIAAFLLTGPPGTPVTIEVFPPTHFHSSSPAQPTYQLRWAHSDDCGQAAFVQIPSAPIHVEKLGATGCSRIRFGGLLAANQAPPGRYVGEMTVLIKQF